MSDKHTYESIIKPLSDFSKRRVIILRGAPGSGKTTLAQKIQSQKPKMVAICEADKYYVRPDGYYDFNWRVLPKAHDWCFDQFAQLVTSWMPIIIVSNTATRLKEYKRYIEMADANGYEVAVVLLKGNFGNVHGCSPENVEKMINRIEEYPNEFVVE